jgi:hypothetical protein
VKAFWVKESERIGAGAYASKSTYPRHGQRVVEGQRLMQPASDLFLGWVIGRRTGISICDSCAARSSARW